MATPRGRSLERKPVSAPPGNNRPSPRPVPTQSVPSSDRCSDTASAPSSPPAAGTFSQGAPGDRATKSPPDAAAKSLPSSSARSSFTAGAGPGGAGSEDHAPPEKTAPPFVVPTKTSPPALQVTDSIEEPGRPVTASVTSNRLPSYRPTPPASVPTQRKPARSWQRAVTWS